MLDFINDLLTWFVAPPDAPDWEAQAQAADAKRRLREQRRQWAADNGWRHWAYEFQRIMGANGHEQLGPYSYDKVWIWRLEWDFPEAACPRTMDPQMNVIGLYWKPWRPSESPPPESTPKLPGPAETA